MADVSFGTIDTFNVLLCTNINIAKIDTNVFVICYKDNNSKLNGAVYSYNGLVLTKLHDAIIYNTVVLNRISCCKVTTNKFAISYRDSGDSKGHVRLVTWTGSVFTDHGSQYTGITGALLNSVCQIEDNKIIYQYDDQNGSDLEAVVGTCNDGTSLTFGSKYDLHLVANASSVVNSPSSGKFICAYRNTSTTNLQAIACTSPAGLADRTLTVGSPVILKSSVSAEYISIAVLDTDKIVICYDNNTTNKGEAIACTLSGTVITSGSEAIFEDGGEARNTSSCKFEDDTHFIVAYSDLSDNERGKTNKGSVNWSTRVITPGTSEIFETGATGGSSDEGLDIIALDDHLFTIAYQDDGDGDKGKVVLGYTPIPGIPTNISIVPGVQKNDILWDAVEHATKYNIYWIIYNYLNENFNTDLAGWNINKDDGAETVVIDGNKLKGDISTGTGWHIDRKIDIPSGDFEIETEMSDYTPDDTTNGFYAYFRILDAYTPILDKAEVYYYVSNAGATHNVVSNLHVNGVDDITPITVAGVPTKFKITRVGTVISVYYYISSWILIDSTDFSSRATNIKVVVYDGLENSSNGGFVKFDNLNYWIDVKTLGSKLADKTSPYEHYPLTPLENYNYVITAENVSGEGSESGIYYGAPETGIPDTPVLTGTSGDSENTLTPSTVSGATKYHIYWSLTSGVTKSNGTKIEDVIRPFNHTNLIRQNYYYVATCENGFFESLISNEICLKPNFEGKIYDHIDQIKNSLLYQYQGD